jgi:non-specific protein-tyrosine kinase
MSSVAFAPIVDAILMVVAEGRTPNNDIKAALQMIPQEKFLGLVMNRKELARKPGYGYYYGG